jgi:hypothetical protein
MGRDFFSLCRLEVLAREMFSKRRFQLSQAKTATTNNKHCNLINQYEKVSLALSY